LNQPSLFVETAHGWQAPPKFHGSTFDEARDRLRLTGQLGRVYEVLKCGRWMTLPEIEEAIRSRWPDTNDIVSAISARIRQLRTECGVPVEKENRGGGTWVYRLGGSQETQL
jgi:hypothetical protein